MPITRSITNKLNQFIEVCKEGDLQKVQQLYNTLKTTIPEEALVCAYEHNHFKVIMFILQVNPDIHIPYYIDLLFLVCQHGDLDALKYFVQIKKIDIDNCDAEGVLDIACENGHLDVVKYLHEIDLDIISEDYEYAFKKACKNGHLHVVKHLLKIKPDINISIQEEYAFRSACKNGHLDMAKYLLEIKPDINIYAVNDIAFTGACENGHLEVVKFLIELKPDWDVIGWNNEINTTYIAFRGACKNGHLHVIKFLLEINPETKKEDDTIYHGFRDACYHGHLEVVKYLLQIKPDIDIDRQLRDALSMACFNGHLEVVKFLIEIKPALKFGCNIDNLFNDACKIQHLELVKYLYEISPNVVISMDTFINVCYFGKLEVVKFILKNKPDFDICANNDRAFRSACLNGYLEIAQLLVQKMPAKYSITNVLPICPGEYIISYNINRFGSKIEYVNHIEKCFVCTTSNCSVKTSCNHTFCKKCITQWLSIKEECPYCRSAILPNHVFATLKIKK